MARHDGPMGDAMAEPGSGGEPQDPRLGRVLREAAAPGLLAALAERLTPTDLQTLLLAVFRRRAAAVTAGRLLQQYESSRFTSPSPLEPLELARLDVLVHERLAEHGFTGVELSPVAPLGTNSAIATVDQNKVVTTVRNTEVVADPTNVLALECAVRRRRLLRADARSRRRVRLGATHRVIRAQAFPGPGMAAHFKLSALCTAGRDEGSFGFETETLTEQIHLHLDVLERSRRIVRRNRGKPTVRVTVTDLTGHRHAELSTRVLAPLSQAYPDTVFALDPERLTGRGYYTGACFEIRAATPDGEDLNIADGGFTTWTADLLSNAKERLLISGLGVERLCDRFPQGPHPPAGGAQPA